MFKLDPEADLNGTFELTAIRVGPRTLRDAFGEPDGGSGDGKVSGPYRFSGTDGTVFSLYDYKMTNLYDARKPEPKTFWQSMTPTTFYIGGRGGDKDAFKAWLLEQIHHVTKR